MEKCIIMIAATSLVMSCIVIGLILFNTLFSSMYSAKWRYYIWLIVIAGMIIPFRPVIGLPIVSVQIPVLFEDEVYSEVQSADIDNINVGISVPQEVGEQQDSDITALSELPEESRSAGGLVTVIIFAVWLAGALFTLSSNLWRHKKFISLVRRWESKTVDSYLLSALWQVQLELGIPHKKISLKTCRPISSPMLTGFVKPVILLPDKSVHRDELLLILKHELIHYKRKDLWVNLSVVIATAIYWFNPIVYIMANMIRNDCEASCDEAVLGNSSLENRRMYGETLIGVINASKTSETKLSTNFYGGKNTMKKRITSIMNTKKKKVSLAVLCFVLVFTATLISGSVFALNTSETALEKAQEAALKESGGGTVVKCKTDYEDGVKVYDIKIVNGDTVYEIEVDAENFAIYELESKSVNKEKSVLPVDSDITVERAKEVALDKTGGGEVTKWELKYKNNIKVYAIEVINGDVKCTMDISTADEKIYNYKEKMIDNTKLSEKTASQILSQSAKKSIPDTAITVERAKEIALAKVGGGTVKKWELDYENGKWVYEMEVVFNRTEYEIDINAVTEEIIEFEIDD